MRLRRGCQFPGTCSLVLSLRLRVQLVRLRLSQAACACQEAATMPSLYSRFTHNPLQRMLLVQAGGVFLISTLALFGSSDTSRSGAASPIGDASAYTLLIGAILAACSAAPNTYTVHSGAYPSRDWRDFDEHFEALFRFDKADISRLVHALQLPSKVVTRDRKTFTRDQAITVLLLRFNLNQL